MQRVRDVGESMGLTLNSSKCEVIANPGTIINDSFINSLQHVSPEEATLLGAPLSKGQALDQAWSERCDDLERAAGRLKIIG